MKPRTNADCDHNKQHTKNPNTFVIDEAAHERGLRLTRRRADLDDQLTSSMKPRTNAD